MKRTGLEGRSATPTGTGKRKQRQRRRRAGPAPSLRSEPQHIPVQIAPAAVDADAVKIVRRLRRHGFEAYLVGGCVRDLLLQRVPKDFDVATSARPRQVKRLFRNCRIIGRRFKLAHVYFGEKIIEVSTFRRSPPEAESRDGEDLLIRRDNVYGTAAEDAWRRDFTINALFYDPEAGEVLDYVGGMEDIRSGTIRTIGDPEVRFKEDPVRMMRAVEFSSRLGFPLEPGTAEGIRACAAEIQKAARPRVLEEILQALSCGRARDVFRMFLRLGLFEPLLPELADLGGRASFLRLLGALDAVDQGRRAVGDAVLLYVLLHRRVREEEALYAAGGGPPHPLAPLENVLSPFVERMGVSRKLALRVREIYLGLKHLRQPDRARRAWLLRRPHLPETLTVYEILCRAAGRPLGRVARWRERLARANGDGAP